MKIKRWRYIFCLFLYLFLSISLSVSQTIVRSFVPLEGAEVFSANKKIVEGQLDYTITIYRVKGTVKKPIEEMNVASDYIICASGKKLFLTMGSGGNDLPIVFLFDGTSGTVKQLGQFRNFSVSSDGNYFLTYLYGQKGEKSGKGQLYSVSDWRLISQYDFNSVVTRKYPTLKDSDYFDLSFMFNDELNGFEILFDQWGEVGPLSFTGIITLKDKVFSLTDRKKELMKKMGY
jgi:hypothetical protein